MQKGSGQLEFLKSGFVPKSGEQPTVFTEVLEFQPNDSPGDSVVIVVLRRIDNDEYFQRQFRRWRVSVFKLNRLETRHVASGKRAIWQVSFDAAAAICSVGMHVTQQTVNIVLANVLGHFANDSFQLFAVSIHQRVDNQGNDDQQSGDDKQGREPFARRVK